MKPEQMLALKLANWIKTDLPEIIYRFDLAADLKLTIGQAKRNKALNRITKYPDLFIAENTPKYGGLYIELKATREKLYKKDGELKNDKHILLQNAMLHLLRHRGFKAEFACGLEEAQEMIINYMKEKDEEH